MSDLIKREDAIEALTAEFCITGKENARTILNYLDLVKTRIKAAPSADRQGWVDKAISIIDDMQRDGIIDYEQAREFRMRARMKGGEDEAD